MKDAWTVALQRALSKESEPVPKGWLTAKQIAEQKWKGLKIRQINKRLEKLTGLKIVEKRTFKISDGKILRPIAHYRVIA